MANQVIVTNTGNVQVALTPPANVQVQISRAAIGTVANVLSANFANFAGNVTSSSQPNITSLGTLTTLSATGTATFGNVVVTGNLQVGNLFANNANYSNFAGQVVDNTQSNITSLGILTNLSVSGNITSGNANLGNLVIANYFSGNGSSLSSINGANVSQVSNAGYADIAGTAYSVSGANVSGEVANANYSSYANIAASANSVALANVSGIGNIANINLDGSSSNVLFGNGVFAPESTSIANANYANFAGTAFSVAVGNVTGIGNIATVNLDGNASNALQGNGTFGPYSANATILTGTILNNGVVSSSLTSVGTLTSLSVSGNANLGNLVTANFFSGDGSLLSNVNGSNVSNVANANYANFAGTAYSVSGANVSGEVANAN
jgi:hypothetical protein